MRGLGDSLIFSLALLAGLPGCGGREPSSLLRQGELPVYDFPLYLSEGVNGTVWKYTSDRQRTPLVTGLNNPLGIATDRSNHVYVVEQGAGRLLKVDATTGIVTVVASGLQSPSVVTVDSVGEAFVAQDTPHNVIRASDGSVVSDFYSLPAALASGVGDILLVGDVNANKLYWGKTSDAPQADVNQPVNVAIDGTGRVYVAEGLASNARVIRFHQRDPGGAGTVVAQGLSGPQGIAVDSVGNIFIVEKGQLRISLVTYDGQLFSWASQLTDPQYLAFTQY